MKKLKLPLAEDAVLFVQALPGRLASAMDLLTAWGFKYRTFLVWEHGGQGSSPWSLENHHVLLLGVRGKHQPPSADNRPPFVTRNSNAEPSTESTIVYQQIKEMFPGSKYLEVFVQSHHEGWTPWLAG
jgi:N6-adenosine-specific RNA methylase IME4